MSSYYKKINGKNYDRAMLDVADKGISGKGDGRISLNDAKAIFKKAKDGGSITDIELITLNHILEKYKFTEPALKYIEDSLSDDLVLKDKGISDNVKQEHLQKESQPKESPKENMPVDQKKEKKAGKLKYLIIFLCLLIMLIVFLVINFLCKKNCVSTDNNNGIVPALNNEEVKKDTDNTENAKNIENSKSTENSKSAVQADKNEYVVQPSDTLIKISETVYGDYRFWREIYRANKDKIKNPVLIYPGQVLKIPEKS